MLNRKCFWLIGVLYLQACLGCATTQNAEQRRLADRQSLDAQLSLARLSERHGKLDFAKQIYENALESAPNNVVAHHRLAVIDARQGRLDQADKHFKAAMKSGRPSVELLSDYGYALYLKEDLEAAERILRDVVEREPRHTAARNNLALVLGEQGRFNESFQEFRMAVDEPEALANIAYVKSQMGEFQDAQKAYHRALALKGDMRPAAEALIQLAEIDGVIRSSKSLVDPTPISPPSPPSIRTDQIATAQPGDAPRMIKNVSQPSRLPSRTNLVERAPDNKRRDIQLTSHESREARRSENSRRPTANSSRKSSVPAPTPNTSQGNEPPQRNGVSGANNRPGAAKLPGTRAPSFFPGSVSPKQIDFPSPSGPPTASKIEALQPLSQPTFETSFVDDMHTEFPGGNTISSGQSIFE